MRDFLRIYLGVIVIAGASLAFAWRFVGSPPPSEIRFATGVDGGFYAALGERFRAEIEREGVRVVLVPSAGSVENLASLERAEGGVDVAFVQGGIGDASRDRDVVALGSLALEPLWIFVRRELAFDRLDALVGRRVAVGGLGSGTRALVMDLLAAAGVASQVDTLDIAGAEAERALLAGEVDVLFAVTAPQTALVRRLLLAPGIELVTLRRAEALTRRFAFLTTVRIPAGTLDLAADLPPRDVTLVATATNLLARADLHPAIGSLLLQVAGAVSPGDRLLGTLGAFPSARHVDHPLSAEARRHFERGPTALRRYLPFWLANLVERLWVLLIPVVAVLIPLLRIAPPTFRWQVRRRIYRWYREVREVECEGEAARDPTVVDACIARLDALQHDVGQLHVPLAYADGLYHLRLHIRFVRERLDARRAATR
ncbi:MAG: ABC transporter substrate-binding protein [Ectothiorhodospiraceae bacterium]|nr:ABC transporter substrate-binding protein [Chromatiales bacterium]MCP5156370.1 ABC transporter substrate-binding protein [Ectothiorhodospiraceae bacterium]